jgi:hypothetical protein
MKDVFPVPVYPKTAITIVVCSLHNLEFVGKDIRDPGF